MALLADSLFPDLLAILITLIAGIVVYYKYLFTYWSKRGLDYIEPSIPFGNSAKLFLGQCNFGEQFALFYREFKRRNVKHGGVYVFGRPYYVPTDPEIIHKMCVKDFQHFVNRGFYVNEQVDPLSGHLFSLEDDKWKSLRNKLSPTFTSGKMKMMFETMNICGKSLEKLMDKAADNKEIVEIKDVLQRFTTDIISSCAFGVDSNSLKNPDTEFTKIGTRIVVHKFTENLKQLCQFVLPWWLLNAVKFKITKPDVEDFIMNLVNKTVDYREKNNVFRKDFLHLLLQLKNRGTVSDDEKIQDSSSSKSAMNINELAAQVFVFFIAGYETSSTAMSFSLYELAINQDVQDKLREEIREVLRRHNGQITYEAINEMIYLENVVNESLRKYPPVPMLNRQCTIPYKIPGTDLVLEKGTMLVFPIIAIQNDPEFFPEPDKFDPDRFKDKSRIANGTFLPFGEGPRHCIGLRFGLMQSKMGLATLIRNYRITLSSKTRRPLQIKNNALVTSVKDGIYINVEKVI